MSPAKAILLSMLRENLAQAEELAQIGKYTMAAGHLDEARLQLEQLSEVDRQEAARPKPQQLTIDI